MPKRHFYKGAFYGSLLDCATVAAGAVYFACAFGLTAFGGCVMVTIVKVCGLAAGGYTGLLDAALRRIAVACKSRQAWRRLRDMAAAAADVAWGKKLMAAYVAANAWRITADNCLAQFTQCGRATWQAARVGKTHLRVGGRYALRRYGQAAAVGSAQQQLSGIFN